MEVLLLRSSIAGRELLEVCKGDLVLLAFSFPALLALLWLLVFLVFLVHFTVTSRWAHHVAVLVIIIIIGFLLDRRFALGLALRLDLGSRLGLLCLGFG